jgi:hypothetical protein
LATTNGTAAENAARIRSEPPESTRRMYDEKPASAGTPDSLLGSADRSNLIYFATRRVISG